MKTADRQLTPATLDAIRERHAKKEHAGRIAYALALPLSVVRGVIEALTMAADFDAMPVDVEGDGIRAAVASLAQTAPRRRGGA